MLQLLPFLAWLAVITSATLLTLLWSLGELRRAGAGLALGWFLLAAYLQFFAGAALVQAAGLAAQTILAIGLLLRWKTVG